MDNEKIFISIASFNEEFIRDTIMNAVYTAKFPKNLVFGVVQQRTDDEFIHIPNIANIKEKKLRIDRPMGTGIARNMAMSMMDQEKYFLSIDAHMIFNHGWDEKLILKLKKIAEIHGDKVVISQHMPSATIKDNRMIPDPKRIGDSPATLYFNGMHISGRGIERGVEFLEQYALTSHFIFSFSKTFKYIKFDPEMFYLAEEPTLSMRLCTRGYKIFCTDYVPMFHLQKENDKDSRGWKTIIEVQNIQRECIRMYDILNGKILGEWGAPDINSLNNFREISGMDSKKFMNKKMGRVHFLNKLYISRKIKNMLSEEYKTRANDII